MSEKLKHWKTTVEQRLVALERVFKNRSSKPPNTEATEPPSKPSWLKKVPVTILRWSWRLFVWGGVSLGVVTGYLALVPKVTVVETPPLTVGEPFSAQFVIQNDGPLGINNLHVVCRLGHMRGGNLEMSRIGLVTPDMSKTRMEVGERAAIPCPLRKFVQFAAPVQQADITIESEFRPDFTFWRSRRTYRFVTANGPDGHLLWLPQAISK